MDVSPEWIMEFVTILSRPFTAFFYDGGMIYWPYLLSAMILAAGVIYVRTRGAGRSFAGAVREQLSSGIWWSDSTKADYRYYIVNVILFGTIFAPFVFASEEIGQTINSWLSTWLGAREAPLFEPLTIRIAYTVCFFVAYDFGRFLAHWVQHMVPVLWQFHKVHHSAEALTPITSFRLHPVDLMLMNSGGNLFGGAVTGLFYYLGAGHVTVYTFLGAHLFMGIYNLMGNLRHSHVWLDYGWLGNVFISPAQHQIHHSCLPRHINKNCGGAFAFWDALFGTLYVPKEKETLTLGLGDGSDGQWHNVGRMYLWPVVMAAGLITGKRDTGSVDTTRQPM